MILLLQLYSFLCTIENRKGNSMALGRSLRRSGIKFGAFSFLLCTAGTAWLISILSDPTRTVVGYRSSIQIRPKLSVGLFSSKSSYSEYSSLDNNATIRQREMEMAIGKAADTLRKDYPNIFKCCPDYDIYDPDVELVDPSGVTLHGLANYKRTYGILRAIVNFLYNPEESGLTFRLLYDYSTKSIRVTWHAVLIPKSIYGGYARRVHLDGISVYEMDRDTGLIYKHRLDRTCLNNIPIQYPQGIWNALHTELVEPNGIPVGVPIGGCWGSSTFEPSLTTRMVLQNTIATATSSNSKDVVVSDTTNEHTKESATVDVSEQQLERRNKSRAKFGLKPLSMEEFLELEQEVQVQDLKQRKKLEQQQQQHQQAVSYSSEPKTGLFDKFFAIPDKCESNDDCERPLVCCDFIFRKVCCASGVPVGYSYERQMRPVMIPVPVEPDYPNYY
mmetsp:Transcript_9216/g.13359  ORF Transcript_9216/g.13359 Transcript_9216/m.13359 type:complete len:445 (+) Transcript_9216:77-1411(+)